MARERLKPGGKIRRRSTDRRPRPTNTSAEYRRVEKEFSPVVEADDNPAVVGLIMGPMSVLCKGPPGRLLSISNWRGKWSGSRK